MHKAHLWSWAQIKYWERFFSSTLLLRIRDPLFTPDLGSRKSFSGPRILPKVGNNFSGYKNFEFFFILPRKIWKYLTSGNVWPLFGWACYVKLKVFLTSDGLLFVISEIRDGKKSGSGINIPDPQHWPQVYLERCIWETWWDTLHLPNVPQKAPYYRGAKLYGIYGRGIFLKWLAHYLASGLLQYCGSGSGSSLICLSWTRIQEQGNLQKLTIKALYLRRYFLRPTTYDT